jgi:hypothetical protein
VGGKRSGRGDDESRGFRCLVGTVGPTSRVARHILKGESHPIGDLCRDISPPFIADEIWQCEMDRRRRIWSLPGGRLLHQLRYSIGIIAGEVSVEDFKRCLDEIVDPTVKEFEDHPDSKRHAFIACVVIFHAIDYLAFPKKSSGLRQQFRKNSPDFEKVDAVAHAFKHVESRTPDTRLNVTEIVSHGGAFSSGFSDNFDISKVADRGSLGPDVQRRMGAFGRAARGAREVLGRAEARAAAAIAAPAPRRARASPARLR